IEIAFPVRHDRDASSLAKRIAGTSYAIQPFPGFLLLQRPPGVVQFILLVAVPQGKISKPPQVHRSWHQPPARDGAGPHPESRHGQLGQSPPDGPSARPAQSRWCLGWPEYRAPRHALRFSPPQPHSRRPQSLPDRAKTDQSLPRLVAGRMTIPGYRSPDGQPAPHDTRPPFFQTQVTKPANRKPSHVNVADAHTNLPSKSATSESALRRYLKTLRDVCIR
ncbi:hypothetical protein SAMN02746095_02782, partial [Acidocella aminolytica 101 = DSM 11237]